MSGLFVQALFSSDMGFFGQYAHFLFRTGAQPLSRLMRRLPTGYVIGFNRRHGHSGQLIQNRPARNAAQSESGGYKSIVCQEVTYLRELVRYIHLNPVRAGMVDGLNKMRRQGYDLDRIAQRVSEVLGMKPEGVFSKGRQNRKVTARSLLCFWAAREIHALAGALSPRLEEIVGRPFSRIFRSKRTVFNHDPRTVFISD